MSSELDFLQHTTSTRTKSITTSPTMTPPTIIISVERPHFSYKEVGALTSSFYYPSSSGSSTLGLYPVGLETFYPGHSWSVFSFIILPRTSDHRFVSSQSQNWVDYCLQSKSLSTEAIRSLTMNPSLVGPKVHSRYTTLEIKLFSGITVSSSSAFFRRSLARC